MNPGLNNSDSERSWKADLIILTFGHNELLSLIPVFMVKLTPATEHLTRKQNVLFKLFYFLSTFLFLWGCLVCFAELYRV